MEGLGSLEFEADPVYSYIWRDFSIKIFKGRLANDMPIICKTYTALINIQDLYPIKKEIEILTLFLNHQHLQQYDEGLCLYDKFPKLSIQQNFQ